MIPVLMTDATDQETSDGSASTRDSAFTRDSTSTRDSAATIETGDRPKQNYANEIKKMMFVSGETAEPSIETTTLIEDITRQQVIEIVSLLFYSSLIETNPLASFPAALSSPPAAAPALYQPTI